MLTVLDIEVFPNYVLFAFKGLVSGKKTVWEIKGEDSCLPRSEQAKMTLFLKNNETFGFNSLNYDWPIILYALQPKKTVRQIYTLSSRIVEKANLKGWMIRKQLGLKPLVGANHFDIMEVAPGVGVSLKLYGARLHCQWLQDLPYDSTSALNEEQMGKVKEYCFNDLETTITLYKKIEERVELRRAMGSDDMQSLLSKSDAQISEAVIKHRLEISGSSENAIPKSVRYEAPEFLKFEKDQCKEVLKFVTTHEFRIDPNTGSPKLPPELSTRRIELGKSKYQMGIGGLHSVEKKRTLEADGDTLLIDQDVASYYPAIVLNLGLYPPALGEEFLEAYREIVEKRLRAKKAGNEVVDKSLKIVINGAFGKFGSKYSAFYDPRLMLTVTLTGQLSLLMLIERLEIWGFAVVSANTDGIVTQVPQSRLEKFQEICGKWQKDTGFQLEGHQYRGLYSRDVNNYLAIGKDNKIKGKGVFVLGAIEKNPQGDIIYEAVINLLTQGVPIRKTIGDCRDIRKFLLCRRVTGGAVFREQYLGKVVRWYYSRSSKDAIRYRKNGNKVPKTDDSTPLMTLHNQALGDVDRERYIQEATELLDHIGYTSL